MTRYWMVALIVAVVGLLFAVRRIARPREDDAGRRALVPHGDGERELVELDLSLPVAGADPLAAERIGKLDELDESDGKDQLDDTAPAVLSPPEWTPPKSAANGSRR